MIPTLGDFIDFMRDHYDLNDEITDNGIIGDIAEDFRRYWKEERG